MKQGQVKQWETLLAMADSELLTYKRLLKEINSEIKTMVDSGGFNVARIREKKSLAAYYQEYIGNFEREVSKINAQLQSFNEPKKIGRPSIGKSRPVKITLPEEDWIQIEQAIESGEYNSYAEYFRNLHEERERV